MISRRSLLHPLSALVAATTLHAQSAVTLLNVSYDPTRELYQAVNAAFAAQWKVKTGQAVTINQSHGGSGKQARSVIDGLDADVVTLALGVRHRRALRERPADPRELADPPAAEQRTVHLDDCLPRRKGNPKHIADWDDLVRPGISGGDAQSQDFRRRPVELPGGVGIRPQEGGRRRAKARAFVAALFRNVPVLDSGARGSTTTFVQRGIGDVLLAWENEALLRARNSAPRSSTSSFPRSPSWPSRLSRSWTRWSIVTARARWRRPTSNSCTHPRHGRSA